MVLCAELIDALGESVLRVTGAMKTAHCKLCERMIEPAAVKEDDNHSLMSASVLVGQQKSIPAVMEGLVCRNIATTKVSPGEGDVMAFRTVAVSSSAVE
jgi:hypothetical protein